MSQRTIESVPVEALIPYARNSRSHSDEQVAQIAASIREFGFTNPVLVDAENGIIAGHGRVLAARKLGLGDVPCIRLTGLTEAQKRAYIIADNKLALNAGWDMPMLSAELLELDTGDFDMSLTGFSDTEIEEILTWAPDGLRQGLTDPDAVPEQEKDLVSRPGDLWILGKHRLLCGDSTKAADVARVMNGELAHLLVTSPPYNQSIDKFRPSGMHKEGDWVAKVQRLAYADTISEPEYQERQKQSLRVWHGALRSDASAFYNHKNRYREKRVVSPLEWLPGPFSLRQEIIWSRPGSVTQNARMFLPSDERIYWLYKGDDFYFDDSTEIKSYSTVWKIGIEANKQHAVAFPVEIPIRCIRACSKPEDIVMEPHCGSGTTIIAAEQTGRVCYALEIDPGYVGVAVRRWQEFTGKQAVLEGDGRNFAEIAAERIPQKEAA